MSSDFRACARDPPPRRRRDPAHPQRLPRRARVLHQEWKLARARSYDALAGRTRAHAILEDDIDPIYRTMAMRSRRDVWDVLLAQPGPPPWLRALDRSWELMDAPDEIWDRQIGPKIDAAFAAMIGPHRQITGVSKVLHLKRPKLVPILDRLVLEQLGGVNAKPGVLVSHYRAQMTCNRKAIVQITEMLAAKNGIERTPVRIMDAILWTAHPASSLARFIHGWEHHFFRGTPF